MASKMKKALAAVVALFLSGCIMIYIGFFKGHDIAITASRPAGASAWSTSQEFITSCTYFPIVIGAALILLAIVLSAVLFSHWITRDN